MSTDDLHATFLGWFLTAEPDLRVAALAVLGSPTDVDDVIQDTALTCWRSIDRYQPDRPFAAWARGVMRHCIHRKWRERGRVPTMLPPAAMDALLAAPVSSPDDQRLDRLRACLQRLTERAQSMLRLRHSERLGWSAVGAQLGMSESAVKKGLFRARQQLVECLDAATSTP